MLDNEEGINKSDELSTKKLELKHLLQEQVKIKVTFLFC